MSTAEKLRQEGRVQGRAEGGAQGRAEGVRQTRLRLLDSRFGQTPEAVVTQLRQADLAALEAWFDRALEVHTLDRVFGR